MQVILALELYYIPDSSVSMLLNQAERNYCMTHKELLAVVTFMKHFHQYSVRRRRTDHAAALTRLQKFKSPEGQLARWLETLQDYQFNIVHRPGCRHNSAVVTIVMQSM